jgi:hypothetical protein
MSELAEQFQNLGTWRDALATSIDRLQQWLTQQQLLDAESSRRLSLALDRIANDRLTVAFVAEFSRGKSELINAMFFADYGRRVLPAAAGRTTMCPTEIMYDESLPPCIRVLPIETRARLGSMNEFKRMAVEWHVSALDPDSVESMLEAFQMVAQTVRVSADEARMYGLYDPADPEQVGLVDSHGMMEISRWRHAIINFPHPLLRDGLVILDTPGLNAIGTEPELTLSLIPNAHAILFVLAADAGVTRSDLSVWRQITEGEPARTVAHLAILNKIDGLWDPLRTSEQVEAEITSQVHVVADTLRIDIGRVFPVSAQKALVAKVNQDPGLLKSSRITPLENALSRMLVPSQRDQLRRQTIEIVERLVEEVRQALVTRERGLVEQLHELRSLQGKNQGAVDRVVRRAQSEHQEFEEAVKKLFASRAVVMRMADEAYRLISFDSLREAVMAARGRMRGVRLSPKFKAIAHDYFAQLRDLLRQSSAHFAEMERLVAGVQRGFTEQMGWSLPAPISFSLDVYVAEIDRLAQAQDQQFNAWDVLTRHKWALIERFFEAVTVKSRDIFSAAQRDSEAWVRSLLPPLEMHAREHRAQLTKRAEAARRIKDAQVSLDDRILQVDTTLRELQGQLAELKRHADRVRIPYADGAAPSPSHAAANTQARRLDTAR